jgi:hypothetical protein
MSDQEHIYKQKHSALRQSAYAWLPTIDEVITIVRQDLAYI